MHQILLLFKNVLVEQPLEYIYIPQTYMGFEGQWKGLPYSVEDCVSGKSLQQCHKKM